MMIGDAMTPFDPVLPRFTPRFTVNVTVFEVKFDVTVFEVKFDVTVFEVKFVEVDVNFFRFNLPLPSKSMLKFNDTLQKRLGQRPVHGPHAARHAP